MKLVILSASSTGLIYPGHSDYPFYKHQGTLAAIADADIVLSLFTPFAPLIAKVREPGLEVVEYRDRSRYSPESGEYAHGVFALEGSTSPAEVAERKSINAEVMWQ